MFDSYSVDYKPRERNPTRGGCVAILINNSLMNRRINGLNNKLEIIVVKIETIDLIFNLISYYESNGNEFSPQILRY